MKIGIVTQQLANNYGGLLQNYALQQVLKGLGHEVKTIDFVYKLSVFKYIRNQLRQIKLALLKRQCPQFKPYVAIPMLRKPQMDRFVNEHIETTKTVRSYTSDIIAEERFDAIITGSDQVWRPLYNWYIEDMYLKFVPDNIKKIAYAASFGVDQWEYTEEQEVVCKALAKDFDAISVREVSGIDLCRKHLGVDATCVLDPTILAGAEAYKPLLKANKEEDYLFAYILDITPEKQEYIKNLARSKGLKAIIQGADQDATLSVEEWLSMIANASMVITDSFHGSVFSILFHKDFYSIANLKRGGARFASLLYPLGLEERLFDTTQTEYAQVSPIDWTRVDCILEKQRAASVNFLTNALK